jgi:hypothetical protein
VAAPRDGSGGRRCGGSRDRRVQDPEAATVASHVVPIVADATTVAALMITLAAATGSTGGGPRHVAARVGRLPVLREDRIGKDPQIMVATR